MENLRYNTIFKNYERRDNFNVENNGSKNSVIWNNIDLILNWNQKDSDLIHVDLNHDYLNQPIPDGLTNIGSIHDSDSICAIDKTLTSPVHSLVHASLIL